MKMMKPQGYKNGGMVKAMSKPTDGLQRQKVGAPNECEWNQGPGVRSMQDYSKKKS